MRGQVVAGLRVKIGARDQRLAGFPEIPHRFGDTLQLAQAPTAEGTEFEMHGLDPIVVARVFERIDDVLHDRLRWRLVERLLQRAIEGISLDLLHEKARRLDVQGGAIRQRRNATRQCPEDEREDHQQEQQVKNLPDPVEAGPEAAYKSNERVGSIHWVPTLKQSLPGRSAATECR